MGHCTSSAFAHQDCAVDQSILLSHPFCFSHAGLDGATPGEKESAEAGFGGLYSEKPEDDANGLSAMSMNEVMQKMVAQQATTHKQEVRRPLPMELVCSAACAVV